jgi:hypothetical protein
LDLRKRIEDLEGHCLLSIIGRDLYVFYGATASSAAVFRLTLDSLAITGAWQIPKDLYTFPSQLIADFDGILATDRSSRPNSSANPEDTTSASADASPAKSE